MHTLRSMAFFVLVSTAALAKPQVSIQLPEKASSIERTAAEELARHLRLLHPDTAFDLNADPAERMIRLGTPQSAPEILPQVGADKVRGPESFVVTTATVDGKETGIILGADPQGVLYGVYGLLEKLGFGFFLSFDALPQPSGKPFNFEGWNLENHPTTPIRIVFNWHNFLSGCSGWDLEQWTSWIDQSQKAGYNTIMVHAYGNNPMFSFTFNGKEKPVGYLTSSVKGRDWSVNHVNDVRRLAGGSVFDKPTFGSAAALAPDDQRVHAATELMRNTFEHARKRGVKVNFAVDFDLPSCNPQSLVTTLDPADRFVIRGIWIARPDTPAGYEFYKAQAQSIVEHYPQVTTLTLWCRRNDGHPGATWPELKKGEMPESWQQEYDARVRQDSSVEKLHQSVPAFGMAKVAAAWRKALDELGRSDINLALGSWGFTWVDACARFLPEPVKLIALDYDVTHGPGEFRNPAIRQRLERSVQPGRFIPVIWAHHDDGQYIGAPLRLYQKFGSELETWRAGGFGIIHWMTHPLDLFFASHSRQTWAATLDEDARATAGWMAARCFGPANREIMGAYLDAWASTMPFFGRETGDFFIDRPMRAFMNPDSARRGCEDRLAILAQAEVSAMTPAQKDRHAFFVEYEKFVSDFFLTETTFERAKAEFAEGNMDAARVLIRACHPETLLERYADAVKRVGITRGEEGLIVSMNGRWIPHYVRFRQRLGLDAVRYNYGATSHDPLAQAAGIFTFHVSPDQNLWQTFGHRETQCEVFDSGIRGDKLADEICAQGIQSEAPIDIVLAPILGQGSRGGLGREPLPAGVYTLTLFLVEPEAEAAGERVMRIEIPRTKRKVTYTFSP
jgi:hypothetical protein